MQMNPTPLNFSPVQAFQELKEHLETNRHQISINTNLRFSKVSVAPFENKQESLHRDLSVERSTMDWLETRISKEASFNAFHNFAVVNQAYQWPKHYVVRSSCNDSFFFERENVFLYFPYAYSLPTLKKEDVFSVELLDVSLRIYRSVVFPCTRRVFRNAEDILNDFEQDQFLERCIYLYSFFHELGHQVGHWSVLNKNKEVSKFEFSVLGEFSSDLYLIKALEKFPEVAIATFLIRAFWYRRRYSHQKDNDSWIGHFLLSKAIENHAIQALDEKSWKLDTSKIQSIFFNALDELLPMQGNANLVSAWMKKESQTSTQNEIDKILLSCVELPVSLKGPM